MFVDAENKRFADEEARFGILPERVVSDKEKPFGYPVTSGMHVCEASENGTRDVSSIVVSFALFDGDEMLFACLGIPLPFGTATKLDATRFVISSCLVREFNSKRNRDDNLRRG
nr:unnamed protein product [Digitaria exilis]